MKNLFTCTLFLITCTNMLQTATAQPDSTTLPGVYFLVGVMETASVLDLKADSTFEFFFSQGALDRSGRGRWTVKDGRLLLNSTDVRPPKDYAMVNSKKVPGDVTVIKMVDKNTMILSYSQVTIKSASVKLQKTTNSHGEAIFKATQVDSIELLFQLCSERSSIFSAPKDHNYVEFRLEPWIADIFFSNFSLQIEDKLLTGKHPLLQGNSFTYEKEKQQ